MPGERTLLHTSSLSRRQLILGASAALGALTLSSFGMPGVARAESGGHRRALGIGAGPFHVGEYLKFRSFRDHAGVVQKVAHGYITDTWFENIGLLPVNVVYDSHFLDGKGAGAVLNADKLRALARDANSAYPVSLDAEAWDTFWHKPEALTPTGKTIVQNLLDVVRTFKEVNPSAEVGVYGEVPQTIFDFTESSAATFDKLNPHYAAVARAVDYYSPSLYNYRYDGTRDGDIRWARAAAYAIHACRMLDAINHTSKPILPYITPGWTDGQKAQRYLTYEQMLFQLTTLKHLGAQGCVLWLGDGAKEPGGDEILALDPHSGWLKAAVDFATK